MQVIQGFHLMKSGSTWHCVTLHDTQYSDAEINIGQWSNFQLKINTHRSPLLLRYGENIVSILEKTNHIKINKLISTAL